jgi:hypothetical protein
MGLLDRIRGFLKPLPQQTVMDRKADIDPTTDARNTLSNPGETTPNPSLAEDMDAMGSERRPPHE